MYTTKCYEPYSNPSFLLYLVGRDPVPEILIVNLSPSLGKSVEKLPKIALQVQYPLALLLTSARFKLDCKSVEDHQMD